MNKTPCNQCAHFDQQFKYKAGVKEAAWYGWCKKQSVYPAQPWDDAQFDLDVKRAAPGEPSKPFVVEGKRVQLHCLLVVPL